MSSPLLAHQGGWDEILFVLGPILAIAALLRLAKRRVDRQHAETAANEVDSSSTDDA